MWSHYADEHKGIVIEFDYHALKTHFNKILSVSNSIERVLYNRERHEVLPCTTSPKRNLLTKSDDWIYEKEHRVITKVSNADYFVINKEAYEYIIDFYDESYLELLNVEKYKGMIKISINHQACHLMDQQEKDGSSQGESVNILLNFREFLQASCEHSVQIVTAHRRYFLLASDARFA